MLPVYKAISFERIMTGGRTKPWLILAETDNYGIQPYVMKLFDTINLEARDHVTAEVVGHVLATEFDFNVPEAAFIEFGEDFLGTINDDELLSTIEHKDARLKFATALVDGSHLFSAGLPKKDVERVLDIQTLFAFDNFIRNRGRNNSKPNMLVKADELFLIDHEMGLELNNKTITDFNDNIWDSRFMKYHVCYQYLTKANNRAKGRYFETFEEYLRNVNLNKLSSYFKQLNDLGFATGRHALIKEYLEEIKNNSTKFVNLLKSGFDEEIF